MLGGEQRDRNIECGIMLLRRKALCKLFGVPPSKTLDMQVSASEFATNVACLLGVDVLEGDTPCSFCGVALDVAGLHALSCTCGGDQTYDHNAVRDVIYDYCERGMLGPALGKSHLLGDRGAGSSRERPADVLGPLGCIERGGTNL